MCGLFGFSRFNDKTRDMARFLAYAMVFRGDDSWGASNGIEVIKELGPITHGFHIPIKWREGIFHTRGASVGAVTQKNAHPFVVEHEGRRVIGIHNGGVRNWEEMNRRHNRHCEVDSEHLFYHLAERKNLGELSGVGTIIWYDIYDGRQTIHLARWNYGDLAIARLKGDNGIVFCSTKDPIILAADLAGIEIDTFYQPLADGIWHVIEPGKRGEDILAKGQSLGFENYRYQDRRASSYWQQPGVKQSADTCRRCHSVPAGKHIMCDDCWKILRKNFDAEELAKEKTNKDFVGRVPQFGLVN